MDKASQHHQREKVHFKSDSPPFPNFKGKYRDVSVNRFADCSITITCRTLTLNNTETKSFCELTHYRSTRAQRFVVGCVKELWERKPTMVTEILWNWHFIVLCTFLRDPEPDPAKQPQRITSFRSHTGYGELFSSSNLFWSCSWLFGY